MLVYQRVTVTNPWSLVTMDGWSSYNWGANWRHHVAMGLWIFFFIRMGYAKKTTKKGVQYLVFFNNSSGKHWKTIFNRSMIHDDPFSVISKLVDSHRIPLIKAHHGIEVSIGFSVGWRTQPPGAAVQRLPHGLSVLVGIHGFRMASTAAVLVLRNIHHLRYLGPGLLTSKCVHWHCPKWWKSWMNLLRGRLAQNDPISWAHCYPMFFTTRVGPKKHPVSMYFPGHQMRFQHVLAAKSLWEWSWSKDNSNLLKSNKHGPDLGFLTIFIATLASSWGLHILSISWDHRSAQRWGDHWRWSCEPNPSCR